MKNISVSRMTLLLRRDLFSNWKRHLLQLGIIYALLTVFLCGKYYGYFSPFDLEAFKASHPAMLQAYLEQKQAYISSSVVGIGLFYFLFVLSTSFAGISTKQQRISALMLPATNMEKYLTGILSAIVRTFLFMTVGVVLADLTRMAIMPFFDVTMGSLLPSICVDGIYNNVCFIIERFSSTTEYYYDGGSYQAWAGYKILTLNLLYLMAVFYAVFSSAMFRKRAFLWGILLFIGAMIAFAFTLLEFVKLGMKPAHGFSMETATAITGVVSAVSYVIFTYFGYRHLKQLQVIPRKFFSL